MLQLRAPQQCKPAPYFAAVTTWGALSTFDVDSDLLGFSDPAPHQAAFVRGGGRLEELWMIPAQPGNSQVDLCASLCRERQCLGPQSYRRVQVSAKQGCVAAWQDQLRHSRHFLVRRALLSCVKKNVSKHFYASTLAQKRAVLSHNFSTDTYILCNIAQIFCVSYCLGLLECV